MNPNIFADIMNVISKTKAHKDTFVIPKLLALLQRELDASKDTPRDELIVQFVGKACDALAISPIYSDVLVRELYRNVIAMTEGMDIPRANLLEDLLFQSLRRNVEQGKAKRKTQKDARSRILHAALEEFSEKGFHTTTIDSIAERAGIAKGTVYRYFSTKEALFSALKENTLTEFVELARRDLSNQDDILQIIESVIRIYLNFFQTNSSFFKVITQEHRDFGRDFSEKFITELILGLPGLKRRCWKASRNGRLKQMNYFTVFFGIIGFLNGVIQKWLHDGAEGSLLDEIETVKEVLFYGFVEQRQSSEKPTNLKVIS
jgi:AcrR family transcriptional regulator